MRTNTLLLALVAIVNRSIAQDYDVDYQNYADGYEQDSLYEDYAMQQGDKGGGKGG